MITVVDAICGSGKSTAMLDRIVAWQQEDWSRKFIYITPFLTEVEHRVPNHAPHLMFTSPNNKGKGKLDDFETLLDDDVNIVSTHVLFGMFNDRIIQKIIDKKYTIIIDEALNCVGLLPDEYNESDTKALLAGEFVVYDKEDKTGKLSWNEEKYPDHDGKYSLIREMCQSEMLYVFNGKFLMWQLSPKLLKGVKEIYVLTYLFEGSNMRGWLELNDIPYKYADHKKWGLRDEKEIKKTIRENLEIVTNRNIEKTRQSVQTLSKSWLEKRTPKEVEQFKKAIRSFVVLNKGNNDNLFWTTYKSEARKLAGAGYSKGVVHKDIDNPCFLPCNTRATNVYSHRTLCVYAMNRYMNVVEKAYLRSNGIEMDDDIFAIAELVQFMFRGSIRNGKPMKILMLSKRMRGLLEDWLKK